MQPRRTTALFLAALLLGGCTDASLLSPRDTDDLTPGRVEVIDVGPGQRLTRIDLEDGQPDHGAWQWLWPGLHRNSYAAQGIEIDSALFEKGSVQYHFARSGYSWIRPRENDAAYPTGFSPILISFNGQIRGSVKRVRVHVGRVYPSFNYSEPYAPYTLTCYEDQTPIGFASVTPPTLYDGPLTYVPLEVAGENISRCVVQPHGYFVMDDIEVMVDRADLRVECIGDLGDNRVTRGEIVVCTPKSGAGEDRIEVEAWSFTGTDSHGQPYKFPGEMDGPVAENTWHGQMAISGTVTVKARVNQGQAQEATAVVTVEARSWDAAPVRANVRKVSWEGFPENRRPAVYPRYAEDLGKSAFSVTPAPLTTEVYAQITDSGPNHYLLFLKSIPAELDIPILVHPEMESRGDFWRRQSEGRPVFERVATCVRSQFPRYVELILAHEGDPPNPQSHSGVYIAEFASRSGQRLEALVYSATDLQAFADAVDAVVVSAHAQAFAAADGPVDKDHPVPFGCNFNFTR